MSNPDILTVHEAAKVLRVSDRTITNWVASNKLGAFKQGRVLRIKREALAQFIADNSSSPAK